MAVRRGRRSRAQERDSLFLESGSARLRSARQSQLLAVAATAGDNGLVPWPGRGRQFDRARTLLFAGWGSDLEPRHPLGRRGSGIGHGSDLQREPGSERDFLRVHPASRTVLIDRRPAFHAADYAADRGSGLCELPAASNASSCLIYRGEFAVVPGRNEMYVWVVDRAARRIWKSRTGRRGHLADDERAERVGRRFRITASRTAATTHSVPATAAVEWSKVGTTWNWRRFPTPNEFNRNRRLRRRDQSLQVHARRPGVRPARKATGSI